MTSVQKTRKDARETLRTLTGFGLALAVVGGIIMAIVRLRAELADA